ncbi:flagellar hook-basal body protein [Planococcus salinus]|uniref:Flagellar hook-basal body protein n=1 Tax=Planococcus salinus TaxID=1848460 RepID=A0A3M8P5T9_9BACL|nr:flagellar hook-basal body protein [Planococcus salinus]RNF38761.1 flagellar hook-basal body protein [Planococcus salinus]
MFRGLYTATAGMVANNRKQQILTNNLANAQTPGFKQDQTVLRSFPSQLLKAMGTDNNISDIPTQPKTIGTLNTGVYAQEGIPSFVQGSLKDTGNSTDFSLLDGSLPLNPATQQRGTLLFAVALENDEVRYTRNGQFSVDAEGFLSTSEGQRVLGENLQPIQVDSKEFTVQEDGQITRQDGTGAGSLWLGYTEEPGQLVKQGQGLLRWDGGAGNIPQSVNEVALLNNTATFVKQGVIEQSNVDLTQTMTDMMNTYRGFESNQKVIQAYDRSMEKAVNEIGRV